MFRILPRGRGLFRSGSLLARAMTSVNQEAPRAMSDCTHE
jgi:hypothetical protein